MTAHESLRRADWSFWVPAVFTVLAAVATVASIIDPRWIEDSFGASRDGGSGQSEWWIAAICAVMAVASAAVTALRWRALRPEAG